MPFKLNFEPSESFQLPEHAVIHVQGTDAQSFLQAQCMNDVAALAFGDWQYNGWLSPQGRVQALFYLLRLDAQHFCIILPALAPQHLINGLNRYVLRAKVRFEIEQSHHIAARFGLSEDLQSSETNRSPGAFILHIGHGKQSRQLQLQTCAAPLDAEAANRWHEIDMFLGWPWINESLQDLWTPHMLGLQQIQAFSLNKGCYPGQEVVARTHYLGKSKRALFQITGKQLLPGEPVSQHGRETGRLVNCNRDGHLGIAVLPIDMAPGDSLDDGIVVIQRVTGLLEDN